MIAELPRGSGAHDDRDDASPSDPVREVTVPVVVVVSASWAAPSRPAPTVLRELGRRWGASQVALLVDDPSEELLEAWSVDVLPTWLKFECVDRGERRGDDGAAGSGSGSESESGSESTLGDRVEEEISGTDLEGSRVTLAGPWRLRRRLTGAQPKHVVDAEFGPLS